MIASACGSDSTSAPVTPPETAVLSVDASQGFAYIRLGTPAQIVSVADPSTSSAWDLGFFATNVVVNGGAVGPAEVTAHCLCQNATATDAAVQAMTVDNQLGGFEAVTASMVPPEASFSSDQLTPAISGWFGGTAGPGATAATDRAWLIRKGTTTVILGKLRVAGIQNPSSANAGQVTIEYAMQDAPGGAFGPSRTVTLNAATGPVYFDLSGGAISSATGPWDISVSGWEIRTNGGVSGSGSVSALVDVGTPYAQIDAAYAATAPAQVYKRDAYSGVFVSQPWYRYNVTGTDNQIWPTFNVYLVKRGADVYKVQLTGYYAADGTARRIGVRYAKLD